MVTMSLSQRFFGKTSTKSTKADGGNNRVPDGTERTTSTASDTTEAMEVLIHYHINILSEKNLNKFWKDLKSGMYNALKSIKFSFSIEPTRDMTKMKHLGDVFAALGSLKHLEDVEFCNAMLFLPSVCKLLKKKSSSSSLRNLKFRNCQFILAARIKTDKDSAQTIEKLWEGVQRQANLSILEIVACSCSQYQRMSYDSSSEDDDFSFQMPLFLQGQKLPNLQRLVLDGCILEDANKQSSFVKLLSNNTSLQELEIYPVFETATSRRQQHQARKRAVRQFLLETIPTTLTSKNNNTLRKLVVSIDDYHLDSVYADALAYWVDLVQDDNHVLTELRATPHPLSSSTKEADNLYGLETNAWLYCNLRYYLRLNELMKAKGQVAPQDLNKKEFLAEMLHEAHDVSCLHQLLHSNPENIMDGSTQSVPCIDFDSDRRAPAASSRRDSCF